MVERQSQFKTFLTKLRKRHIIETFAGFIAGGWLFLEFVDRILIAHYHINEKWLDVAFFTLLAALLCVLIWRWFSGTEKRPGNVKVEVLLVPLIILVALAIDLNLILQIAGILGKKLLMGIVALCFGVAWVIFKLSQWAVGMPETGKKKVEISPIAPARPEKSIVVLPFADLSPQKDQEYFCDGMTEEIITDLSHIHGLLVISRNSAMTFRGTQKKTSEIAKDVNVRYVLEGSVRKAGNDLKITAQLIDAINDAHLWAEKYSGTLDDVFDIQEKVSRSIVGELKLKLTQEENLRISERPVPSFYAYDCYLKARHEIYKWSEEGYDKALKYLQEGLDLGGDNSLIYGGMSYVYYSYVNMGIKSDELYLRKAEEYANKNLEFDPKSPIGHLVLGLLQAWRGDLQNGMRRLKYALALDPNNSDTILWLAAFFSIIGKPEAAIPLIDRFLKLEPLHPMSGSLTGICQMWAGRFDLALESFHKGFQTFPDDLMTQSLYGLAHAYTHRIEEALTILSGLVKDDPKNYWFRMAYGLVSELKGQTSEILASLQDPAFETWAKRDFSYSLFMVDIYVLLGENEKALGWLEHAVSIGYINYHFLNEYDPFLANIRSERRFKKLMERVKYEWEHFEV